MRRALANSFGQPPTVFRAVQSDRFATTPSSPGPVMDGQHRADRPDEACGDVQGVLEFAKRVEASSGASPCTTDTFDARFAEPAYGLCIMVSTAAL
jgi:hypothetical protein